MSHPAFLTTWFMSSSWVHEYCPATHSQSWWSSTSDPLLMMPFENWTVSSPGSAATCNASSPPYEFKINMNRAARNNLFARVTYAEAYETRLKDNRRYAVGIWFHQHVLLPKYVAFCWRENQQSNTWLAPLKSQLTRLFQAFPTNSTELLKCCQGFHEVCHLVLQLHVGPINEPFCVMSITYEGRPESRLSLTLCHFQFIFTRILRPLTVLLPYYST